MKCKICGFKAKNTNSLGKHIHYSHKEYSKKRYYDEFIGLVSPICECGEEKKFRGLGEGYRKFCSTSCRSSNLDVRSKLSKSQKGKKQSHKIIQKRIKNTNQSKKEQTRKQTVLRKYGVENISHLEEVKMILSKKSKGRKQPPRRKEHSKRIIESKQKNGTLKHSNSTRSKIIDGLNRYYQEGDDQSVTVTSLPSNGRGHVTGYHNGILYRSSYELFFILFCEKNNINIESCENKDRRVRYEYQGKKRWYYPDFYLTDYDVCVEIKPKSMMNDLFYVKKKSAEQVYKNFIVITENELIREENLLEHLRIV